MIRASQGEAPYHTDIDAAGHPLVADEGPELGGRHAGPGPFDLVTAGLAACTLITLRMYAQRKGWDGFHIDGEFHQQIEGAERSIRRELTVRGVPDEAGMDRLRDIVERTPVTLALKPGFTITTTISAAAAA